MEKIHKPPCDPGTCHNDENGQLFPPARAGVTVTLRV